MYPESLQSFSELSRRWRRHDSTLSFSSVDLPLRYKDIREYITAERKTEEAHKKAALSDFFIILHLTSHN